MATNKLSRKKVHVPSDAEDTIYNSLDEWKAAFFPKAYSQSLSEAPAEDPQVVGAAVAEDVCKKVSLSSLDIQVSLSNP